jgi:hypothetical protein
MPRSVPFLVGLVVLLGLGAVQGVWTDRWRPSVELGEAAARLGNLPADIGAWKGEEYEQDADELKLAGAVGHWSRAFTDPETGEKVLVILLCGKPARVSVHRPEHCYRSAGFELATPPLRVQVKPLAATAAPADGESQPAQLWTGLFSRDVAKGTDQVRIFWSWSTGGPWEAPDSPRWTFARQPALYKLYVIRSVTGPVLLADDPCVRLLGQLLPILDNALTPS